MSKFKQRSFSIASLEASVSSTVMLLCINTCYRQKSRYRYCG